MLFILSSAQPVTQVGVSIAPPSQNIEGNAEISATNQTWHDDCSTTDGWIRQTADSGFPETPSEYGTLHSDSGYLYVTGLPTPSDLYLGPLFVKELETPITIADIVDFEVELEWLYASSRIGYLSVALYDENKITSAFLYARDSWAGNVFRPSSRYYPQEGESAKLELGDYYSSWRGHIRFWYDSYSASLMGEIDDGTVTTATLKTSGEFNTSRLIKYIGISFRRRNDYPYNDVNLRLHDINLVYLSLATTTTSTTTPPTSPPGLEGFNSWMILILIGGGGVMVAITLVLVILIRQSGTGGSSQTPYEWGAQSRSA
jgi:hypothetical protein